MGFGDTWNDIKKGVNNTITNVSGGTIQVGKDGSIGPGPNLQRAGNDLDRVRNSDFVKDAINPVNLEHLFNPSAPKADAIGTPPVPPNRRQVTADYLTNEVSQERQRAAYDTLFSGAGVLEQPTTASRTLLGA